MLHIYRANHHIIAQDEKGKVTFNLQSKKECELLQSITKAGFDLVMERPYEVLNCDTLVFDNDRPHDTQETLKRTPRTKAGRT